MKAAFFIAAFLGMALCSGGGIGALARQSGGAIPWMHPLTLVAMALGVAGLAVLASPLLGWRLPFVSDYRSGLIALVVIVVAKIAVTQAHLALVK